MNFPQQNRDTRAIRIPRLLLTAFAGVLLVNLLAWLMGDRLFLNDARQLDAERARHQADRIVNMLDRDALSLQRIVLGRAGWLAKELGEQDSGWDSLQFPEFVTEAYLVGANIDCYLIEDEYGNARYAVHYDRVQDHAEAIPVAERRALAALARKPGNENGFAGIMRLADHRVALAVGVPVGDEKLRGWVMARRDIDREQIALYGDLLGTRFSLDVMELPHADGEGSEDLILDSRRSEVHRHIADIDGQLYLAITLPYERTYESHMAATVAVSRAVVLLFSLLAGVLWFLYVWQRRLARQRAEQGQRNLQRVARLAAVGELAAGVAHEINNPIGMIQRNLDFVRDVLDDALPLVAEYAETDALTLGGVDFDSAVAQIPQLVEDMTVGSRRIGDIVRDLKDFSRDDQPDDFASFDLYQVLAAATRLLEGLIRKTTDHFSVDVPEGLPLVAGVERQIEQVVVNLIQNACQALESREQAIVVTIRHLAAEQMVQLTVSDQGKGIPEANVERIFEPFFTTRRETGGTGLGLSVSQRIVRQHRGRLEADSAPGRGTRMTLILPVAKE